MAKETQAHENTRATRFVPRRAGDDDFADAEAAAAAWVCVGATHQANL